MASPQRKYSVQLSEKDKTTLEQLVHRGTTSARVITRARVLLLSHGKRTDKEIYQSLQLADSTPRDIRKRFDSGGIQRALYDAPRPGQKRILTPQEEALTVAIACTQAPKGYTRWTLDLLTEEVKDKLNVTIGRTAIWKILLRNNTKPWLKKNVVYSQSNA